MPYVLNDEGKRWQPIAGVPWRDMTDEEFADVSAAYDAQFSPDQAGSLRRFFDHVKDKDASGAKAGAGRKG